MSAGKIVRQILIERGMKVQELSEKMGLSSPQILSTKLYRESFSYEDVVKIADILNCDVKVIARDTGKEFWDPPANPSEGLPKAASRANKPPPAAGIPDKEQPVDPTEADSGEDSEEAVPEELTLADKLRMLQEKVDRIDPKTHPEEYREALIKFEEDRKKLNLEFAKDNWIRKTKDHPKGYVWKTGGNDPPRNVQETQPEPPPPPTGAENPKPGPKTRRSLPPAPEEPQEGQKK
jgi:transcriptional regulator with XRE-family HTH domain